MWLRFSVTLFPTVVEAGIDRHNRMTDDDEWLSDRERFNRLCLCCFSQRHRGEGDRFAAPIPPVSGHQLILNHKFLDYISISGVRPTLPSRRDTAVSRRVRLLWDEMCRYERRDVNSQPSCSRMGFLMTRPAHRSTFSLGANGTFIGRRYTSVCREQGG